MEITVVVLNNQFDGDTSTIYIYTNYTIYTTKFKNSTRALLLYTILSILYTLSSTLFPILSSILSSISYTLIYFPYFFKIADIRFKLKVRRRRKRFNNVFNFFRGICDLLLLLLFFFRNYISYLITSKTS
jgi:hypothetical protein